MALAPATGWIAAVLAVAVTLITWRAHTTTLESVARASHDLRGPLTAARLGLCSAAHGDSPSPARVRAVELELARATLALDDLARTRLGTRGHRRRAQPLAPACIERFDLRELLADSVEAWHAYAASRGVPLRLFAWPPAAPQEVEGDRLRLAQVTGNLIANAIEHGGGSVVLRCRSEAGSVRVEVTDSGPGLPAPVAELIRRPRGGRGARGRGLAIAAAIAVSHGGRLAAAPSERGARLVLELPPASAGTGVAGLPGV